jgi:hypothetical protein
MLTALILVCSLTSVPDLSACTVDNAVQVIRAPETFLSPVTCFVHGQAYLAETATGRDLNNDEVVKVICAPNRVVAGRSPGAANNSTLFAR